MNAALRAGTIALALACGAALAQSGGGYTMRRHTLDGGGARMTGANGIMLGGTIGQPDASANASAGSAGYRISGGFWAATEPAVRGDALFANGFE
jgi:hypothetical protein